MKRIFSIGLLLLVFATTAFAEEVSEKHIYSEHRVIKRCIQFFPPAFDATKIQERRDAKGLWSFIYQMRSRTLQYMHLIIVAIPGGEIQVNTKTKILDTKEWEIDPKVAEKKTIIKLAENDYSQKRMQEDVENEMEFSELEPCPADALK